MTDQGAKRKSVNGAESKEPEKQTSNGHEEDSGRKSTGIEGSPKKTNKRRKVNHACVYCRRSHMTCDLERPCARCIKRDIGHLCHDEPREPAKRTKSEQELAPAEKAVEPKQETASAADGFTTYDQGDGGLVIGTPRSANGAVAAAAAAPPLVQPKPISPHKQPDLDPPLMEFDQWDFGAPRQNPNHFSDMHSLHPYNTFNTSEVTNEYNLLGDFLSSSLLDDGGLYNIDEAQALFNDPLLSTGSVTNYVNNNALQNLSNMSSAPSFNQAQAGSEISRPSSTFPVDQKARDKFFLTAADPAGNDSPEERMNRLLKAKYDAGLLKPFNYVKGYARLNEYMEKNMRPGSRQKILRQLDKFRPKFREAMQTLTDIQLVKVEMWFERSLMEYDRVFASMAIPACCWRRTGEIFRGNKEMAELIHVPIEQLRDVRTDKAFRPGIEN